MRPNPIEAFKAGLSAVRWDESMSCPVTAPTPKHRKLYTIPMKLRAALAYVTRERSRSNMRINYQSPLYSKLSDAERKELHSRITVAPEEYLRLSVEIESAYKNVLRKLKQKAHAGRDAIVELHDDWKYSVTSHWHLRRTYEAKKKQGGKKAPAGGDAKPKGPTCDYKFPQPEVCHLQQYYMARTMAGVTLESYLARELKAHKKPSQSAVA